MNEKTIQNITKECILGIYMIHACANRWRKTAAQVYFALKQSGCLNHYLIPNYDILHTQSTDFVVKDIEEYLAQKDVIV